MRNAAGTMVVAVAALAASAAAAAPATGALGQLQPGLWKLDLGAAASRTVCVGDPFALIQLEEGSRPDCSRMVIADRPDAATLSYDCPRAGWGRTTIKVITARFVRLDTQGIAANAPFALAGTGRRIGACPAAAQRR